MILLISTILRRLFITTYSPDPTCFSFMERAELQESGPAHVTAAVLDAEESERVFGVHLARRGIQPVYLRIINKSNLALRLNMIGIDPNYYMPLEAAAGSHFSIFKRLSAFGLLGVVFFHLLLLLILPSKLFTAYRANRRMDDYFRSRAFRLRPIAPLGESKGFVFTQFDAGTKVFRVILLAAEKPQGMVETVSNQPAVDLVFSIPVPGLAIDHSLRDFSTIANPDSLIECDVKELTKRLCELPGTTTNRKGTRLGDPVNLVVVGDFPTLLTSFVSRWDETETISLATCWKTTRAFLMGQEYRYSPVSPLYLFGRSQDVALQRIRSSINERLHLRLWLTPLRLKGQAVWVGQVSRDIGVRFTTRAWNLTTHRIEPDVDESRDYIVEDLLKAEHLEAVAYVEGVGEIARSSPRHNLTGDPYFSDGMRVVLLLSHGRTRPQLVT